MAKDDFKISGGGFKAAPMSSPKFGGGQNNAQQNMLMAYMLGQQGATQTGQTVENIKKGFGGKVPVGSTATSGKNSSVTTPLNPDLAEFEQNAIAGVRALEPSIIKIGEMLRQGVLNAKKAAGTPFADLERTGRQKLVDTGDPLMTSKSPELQAFQSELNNLKGQLPFTAGGKQLTQTEKDLVFRLLNVTGKSDAVIVSDLNKAFSILKAKEELALGGMDAAVAQENKAMDNPQAGIEQERQKAIKAIQSGKDAKKIADIFRSRTGQELNG